MRRFSPFSLHLFFLTSVLTTLAAFPPDALWASGAHTTVRLLLDVRTARPGSHITAGILLRMAPGWHTYWRYPGDAGMPTALSWTLPSGFQAGAIQWPVPEKYVDEGDIISYGYSREVMLLVPLAVPATLAPGATVTLKVFAEWLECEKVCIPGSGKADATLLITSGESEEANREVFTRARAQLPKPAAAAPEIRLSHALGERIVTIAVTPSSTAALERKRLDEPDFFPAPPEGVTAGRVSSQATGEGVTFTLPLSASQPVSGPLTLAGIVLYRREGGVRQGVAVEVPLPADFCRTLSSTAVPRGGGLLDRSFVTDTAAGGQQSIWYIFLFAVIGGMLLNIMPCVLPVIALKIFGLVRMAGDEPRRVRRLGAVFSLGILTSFLALALVVILLKLAGQQVGWGFQFQEPLFVIAMSAVVCAFGLSLFGVFEIRLPGGAVAGVSGLVARQEEEGKGYVPSFFEGVFATILATPCTAPFLGTALGFAFAQPWWMILAIFSLVAFGMALPYLVLTARPAWMRFLPRPGAWMETAKQFMGFLMMATLLWLLYVLGNQLGMEGVIWTGAFLLTVSMACWILGRFATLTASRATVRIAWATAVIIILAGYWLFVASLLSVREVLATDLTGLSLERGDEISWQPFASAAVEEHLRANRPVFLDFTAEWCLTCKVNERTVLRDAAVLERFRTSGVIPVRADWTRRNPEITSLLARFGRSGVPLYVLFPAGKSDRPIVLPEVITPGIVLDAFNRAGLTH